MGVSPFGAWLPKAVIAAEDQRFHEHAGYDLAEMAAAWSTEPPEAEGRRRSSCHDAALTRKRLSTRLRAPRRAAPLCPEGDREQVCVKTDV